MDKKYIVLIGTLDTKGEEIGYLRDLIIKRGHRPFIVDIGSGGEPRLDADITAKEVAAAVGAQVESLRNSQERHKVTEIMINGAVAKLEALCSSGNIGGMLSIGGLSSMIMTSEIMERMPYSIPKLIVSSGASMPGSHRVFGTSGITLMHSIVDIGGLNYLLKDQLNKAAGAICGMADNEMSNSNINSEKDLPMVAMSVFGYVDNCSRYISEALAGKFELIRFHAAGTPEIAMEKLIEDGFFSAVIDLVPSSITNTKLGGSRTSWPRRMEAAGIMGVPQVIAPAGVNTLSRVNVPMEELAPELKIRKHNIMDDRRVTVYLNEQELEDITMLYIEKLNKAVGPTKFLVPMKGWLSVEKEDSDLYDRKSAQLFADLLKRHLKKEIEVVEVEDNIDSPAFAEAIVAAFYAVLEQKRQI